jgi:putative phage-type endonuclease
MSDLVQGSAEWLAARCGKITASRIADLIATTKSGPAASRKNYLAELLIERLTGVPTEHYESAEMRWGTEHEPEVRSLYEFAFEGLVQEVGFIVHPSYSYSGASPDGLVGDDGGVEIKCPNSSTHIETLLGRKLPRRYYCQIQWCMECTGRQWWDYVSYDPRMRDSRLVLYRERVDRDEAWLRGVRLEVEAAEAELAVMVRDVLAVADTNV